MVRKIAAIAAAPAAVLVPAFASLCGDSQRHVPDKDGRERNPDRYPSEQGEQQQKGSAEALPFFVFYGRGEGKHGIRTRR